MTKRRRRRLASSSERLWKAIWLRITPHQFRHAVAADVAETCIVLEGIDARRHYNKRRMIEAARTLREVMRSLE